jgi:FtsP/CotA-like multicopper oxidase with cupredoxin domain
MTNKLESVLKRILMAGMAALLGSNCLVANASVPGITGGAGTPVFNLTASAAYITQPDGQSIYSWGYGCAGAPNGYSPSAFTSETTAACTTMQMPGPTLIVTEGDVVTVNLSNTLPAAAGNTSILFPGFSVATTGGVAGLLTGEAAIGTPVTYTFTATGPGTHAYYSGTRPDLQVEMGLFGAVIVVPKTPASCTKGPFSLAASAYDNANTCYDREYLFQFSELSLKVHQQVEAQVLANPTASLLKIAIEPYHPEYFLVNGRSMPDDMDPNYAGAYPHQPYNGNPHMHPGDLVLMRVIGQGRWQHPFHHHGNHARVLARDGNLITSASDPTNTALAGPLVFTVPTVSGQTVDAVFTWTGQGLNWDVYGPTGHTCNGLTTPSPGLDATTKEYCPDHGKALPVTPPDKNIVANGLWYGGTPYLGVSASSQLVPGTTEINTGGSYAYMWHSHDEREITTNDIFPGGMMMMLLIDPPAQPIDEQQ